MDGATIDANMATFCCGIPFEEGAAFITRVIIMNNIADHVGGGVQRRNGRGSIDATISSSQIGRLYGGGNVL